METKINDKKNSITKNETLSYSCIRCGATKDSNEYNNKFCSKCRINLEILKEFKNKDCPICIKKKSGFFKVLKSKLLQLTFYLATSKKSKLSQGKKITIQYCNCGNYLARSISGIIDNSCKNCGGKPPPIIFH